MLADRDELLARAKDAVAMAKEAGADDVFASANRYRSVEMQRRDGKLEKVSEATSRGLGIEIWVDGRFSSASTTDLRPDRLRTFVADAVALTRALQPDKDRQIPDPDLFEGRSDADLELADPAVAAITREDRLALLAAMAAEVEGKDGVISAQVSTSDAHGTSVAVSSNGFEGDQESTSLWLSSTVTMRDAGDGRPEGFMDAGARHRADVPDPAWVGREALREAKDRLGTTKGPTTKTTMIVHPMAAGRLISSLLQPAHGSAVQQGRSFWAGRLGKPAVSALVTVTDEPLLKRGLGSRRFDGEGIAAKPMPVMTKGALQNYYLDTTYARKLGMTPTTGGPSNRVMALGAQDLAAILKGAGNGILVTSWLGGNMDGTTGDFSYGLRGHLVENGVIGAPVGEMNVTGNLLTLFGQLAEVGNDPWKYRSLLVPTLVFEDVSFSGA